MAAHNYFKRNRWFPQYFLLLIPTEIMRIPQRFPHKLVNYRSPPNELDPIQTPKCLGSSRRNSAKPQQIQRRNSSRGRPPVGEREFMQGAGIQTCAGSRSGVRHVHRRGHILHAKRRLAKQNNSGRGLLAIYRRSAIRAAAGWAPWICSGDGTTRPSLSAHLGAPGGGRSRRGS